MLQPCDFLPNGIVFGCLEDQMAILTEETRLLKEEAAAVLLRACHLRERLEAIKEKYALEVYYDAKAERI